MNTTTTIEYASIRLSHGNHAAPEEGMCLLEAAAYIAGEHHTDHPQCVCPVLAAFGRSWNDGLESDDERDRLLKPLLPKLINTKGSADLESRRSWMALDWLIRVQTPAWMDLTKALREHAAILRALPPQVNTDELKLSAATRAAAQATVGNAVGTAAWVTTWTTAGAAAWAAARAVAWATVRTTVWATVGAAVRAATEAAAEDAKIALAPTISVLKQSAFELFENMIALKD